MYKILQRSTKRISYLKLVNSVRVNEASALAQHSCVCDNLVVISFEVKNTDLHQLGRYNSAVKINRHKAVSLTRILTDKWKIAIGFCPIFCLLQTVGTKSCNSINLQCT